MNRIPGWLDGTLTPQTFEAAVYCALGHLELVERLQLQWLSQFRVPHGLAVNAGSQHTIDIQAQMIMCRTACQCRATASHAEVSFVLENSTWKNVTTPYNLSSTKSIPHTSSR